MIPRIAIVGRPNVGKSSLMNMLAGRKVSITDDTPGTTRDRVSTIITLMGELETDAPVQVELTDTGGYGVYTRADGRFDDAGMDLASLTRDIEGQIAKAVANADLVMFVVDTQAGVTPMDEAVARLLREGGLAPAEVEAEEEAAGDGGLAETGKAVKGARKKVTKRKVKSASAAEKIVLVANKADGPKWENHAFEAAALGFGEPLIVSAKNNYMRRDLNERLHKLARAIVRKHKKERTDRSLEGPAGQPDMKLAIVGKRNSGKSTLVNTVAGEERVIVSEIAGTTRDAIDVRFTMEGRSFLAIDTAGLRRKKSFDQRIEWWALDRMEQAIDRCDVALVMIDATEPLSHVDHQVGMMLAERNKPAVIVVNKWDLAEGQMAKQQAGHAGKAVTPEVYEDYIRKELKGLWYAPIAFISAKNNENVTETINLAFELAQQAGARMGTGVLNRVVRTIVERQGPPSRNGTFAKVYYAAQIGNYPPTIALVVNKPDMFTQQYERFLLNRLRNESPFGEVPIKLVIKGRSKRVTAADTEEIQDLVKQAVDIENEERTKAATSRGRRAAITRQADDAGEYFDQPSPMADAVAHQLEEALAPLTAPRGRPKVASRKAKARPKAAEAKARTKKRSRGSRLN